MEEERYNFANGPTDSAVVLDVPQPVMQAEKKGIKAKDPEFIVAVVVLSVLGGLLVLAALVLFGIHYMTAFILGMFLYAFALVVILVSELAIRRKLPKLSLVLTSVGIGGMYLSTFVNSSRSHRLFDMANHASRTSYTSSGSLTMNNFSAETGVCIAVVFTLLVLLYGWKRQISLYRVVGILFCYLCIQPGLVSDTMGLQIEFWIMGALILALNVAHALLPVKRHATAVFALPMAAFMLYSHIFLTNFFRQEKYNAASSLSNLVYLAGVLLVIHLYLFKQLKAFHSDNRSRRWERILSLAVYVVTMMEWCHLVMYSTGATWNYVMDIYLHDCLSRCDLPALHFAMLSLCAMGLICFILLRQYKEKWILYYFGNLAVYQIYLAVRDFQYPAESHADRWCVLALLVLAKVLAFRRIRAVRPCDAVLTFLACGLALAHTDEWQSYLLMAALLLSLFIVRYWHVYYELIVIYTLAFFAIAQLPVMLKPLVFVGVLFLGLLLINNVKGLKGAYPLICNAVILAGQILGYLVLVGHRYRNSYVTHLCMLVLGLGIITLILQEKYHLNCRLKLLIVELFLCYMTLVMRLPYSFVTSILLMAIAALVGVTGGFLLDQKSARICGLVFSILVCGKIVLYDFRGGPALQRIFLFLAVGVLALGIAGIYIILEKKTQEKHASQLTGGGK